MLVIPALASAEELPEPAEIQSTDVPVSGRWVKVNIANTSSEGTVCNGTIGIFGVTHPPGGRKVARLSDLRDINLLGGEERPVAIRLLRGVWTAVASGREREARASLKGPSLDATKIVYLVTG